jgi:hypothetical protein
MPAVCLCDDWGWYVDIENVSSSYDKKQQEHNYNVHINYNNDDDEDEYTYYLHMNKKTDFNIEYYFNGKKYQYLDNIATTTTIIAILTYIFLFR